MRRASQGRKLHHHGSGQHQRVHSDHCRFRDYIFGTELLKRLTVLTDGLPYDAGVYNRSTREWTFDIGQLYIHKKAAV